MKKDIQKKVLVVHSSPREGSVSRRLTAQVVNQLQEEGAQIVTRDLAAKPLPHLTDEVITAFYTRPEQRSPELAQAIALSDETVDELLASDVLVIGAPMWNFNVPSVLKAWIDHVARAGRTFQYTANGIEGLAKGRKAIIVLTSGGIYSKGPGKAMDFHETYLRSVLGFIGITDVHIVRAEGVSMGDEAYKAAIASAELQLAQAVRSAA